GARMYSQSDAGGARIGLTAAALLAVAPFHAMESHRASPDILLTFTVALVMAASWSLSSRPSAARAVLAGMAAGLAFGAKQNGLPMAIPVGWACAEVAYERRSVRVLFGFGALAFLGLVAVWVLVCPPCVLRYDSFVAEIMTHRLKMSTGKGGVMNHLV